MSRELKIQAFDDKQVRIVWDDEQQKYYFSVTDVVGVLTEQPDARGASTYWAVLKKRLRQEGANELITNCKQLKLMATDGKTIRKHINNALHEELADEVVGAKFASTTQHGAMEGKTQTNN